MLNLCEINSCLFFDFVCPIILNRKISGSSSPEQNPHRNVVIVQNYSIILPWDLSFILAFGPWFIGYLLTEHLGAVFAWGIIINDTFIPGGHAYMYAIFQFLTFTLPLTLLECRYKQGKTFMLRRNIFFLLLLLLFYSFVFSLAFGEFVQAYGWMAFVLGPLRTGNLFLFPLVVWLALYADVKKNILTTPF